MQVLKTIPIILGISLLVSSCEKKPGKYNLTGVWESKCTRIDTGSQFTEDLVYHSNGNFEGKLNIKYKNKEAILYSGTYKADKKKIEEKITKFNVKDPSNQIIKKQTRNLEWINNNSIVTTLSDVKCTAIRIDTN